MYQSLNSGRKTMNMFDEALAIKTMLDMRAMSRKELSKSLGISESCIANKLRLLNLSERVRSAVTDGGLTERHARILLRIDGDKSRLEFAEEISSRRLTVAEAEALFELKDLRRLTRATKTPSPHEAKEAFVDSITQNLASLKFLGVNASSKISYHGDKTYITVIID
jgi:ParB family chromosome partitioning protein